MNDKTFLDLLSDRSRGRLLPEESAELDRRIAEDPELAALARDHELVHALTAVDGPAASASRTSFEELAPRLRAPAGPRPLRHVAAAAAVVLLTGAAFLAGRWSGAGRGATAPLLLGTIDLSAPLVVPTLAADLPVEWLGYDPRGEHGVRFLHDLDEAERLAAGVDRPLLVYGAYPDCPLAAALDAEVFSDPAVVELMERTVPVRVNLAELPDAEQRSYTVRGYPFLEVWGEGRRTQHSLVRAPDPARFVESLHDGLEKSGAVGEQPPWQVHQALVRRFLEARAHERGGALAEAEAGYLALVQGGATLPDVASCAAAGLSRIAGEARSDVVAARAAAERGELDEAERLLRAAVERFRGSRHERDLAAVLERLVRDGVFPRLAAADHSV